MLAQGMTVNSIAQQLCLSAKTVANYSTLLKSKLHVENAAELVHLAISAGVIRPGRCEPYHQSWGQP